MCLSLTHIHLYVYTHTNEKRQGTTHARPRSKQIKQTGTKQVNRIIKTVNNSNLLILLSFNYVQSCIISIRHADQYRALHYLLNHKCVNFIIDSVLILFLTLNTCKHFSNIATILRCTIVNALISLATLLSPQIDHFVFFLTFWCYLFFYVK